MAGGAVLLIGGLAGGERIGLTLCDGQAAEPQRRGGEQRHARHAK